MTARMHESSSRSRFHGDIRARNIPRVPGTAVFLTRTERDTPPVMVWHVKHNRALHEHLFVLRVEVLPVPWVTSAERINVEEVAPNFWRAEARFGFMERPHIPELLTASKALRLHGRPRRCDLLRRPRDGGRPRGRPGLARLAGAALRRHGAQRGPCQRLLQPALRSGRRDRAAGFDLRETRTLMSETGLRFDGLTSTLPAD